LAGCLYTISLEKDRGTVQVKTEKKSVGGILELPRVVLQL
jgi:hypothetical protein